MAAPNSEGDDMEIDLLEPVQLGGSTQWIRIRAANTRNPLLLRDRFDMPAVVAGFSMGATIAVLAAARRPDLVAALVAVGMDIDGAAAEKSAYEFALATARARKNRRAIRQLEAIGPPPHLEPQQFATRARWATNFRGVRSGHTYNSVARSLLSSLLRSPDYSLADAVRTFRGITAAQAALLPELSALDLTDRLTRLNSPIVMVQGRHDQVAPASSAERYAELLEAPSKRLVWFEHSAHMPHLEEPERFRELLARLRLGLPANA
jgi:pimeloyl-ACP methyl ester carboxylesterase